MIFFSLIFASVEVAATCAQMTLQRRWRNWLNTHVLDQWLISGRYYQLNLVPGDHDNPEYRVAEDEERHQSSSPALLMKAGFWRFFSEADGPKR